MKNNYEKNGVFIGVAKILSTDVCDTIDFDERLFCNQMFFFLTNYEPIEGFCV